MLKEGVVAMAKYTPSVLHMIWIMLYNIYIEEKERERVRREMGREMRREMGREMEREREKT